MSRPGRPSFNIGIEEEYQTIDPESRDLRSHIHAEIVQKGKTLLAERVKPEMHQSLVEIGTGVCRNIQEAHEEIRDIRHQIIDLARANGLRLEAAGKNSLGEWGKEGMYLGERYMAIVGGMKRVGGWKLIFG